MDLARILNFVSYIFWWCWWRKWWLCFCGFYNLGWLTGCGCHGGHGYPPLDGVDKKSGEVGGLPEARGLAHIASLRLLGITINIDWHGSRQKNTKEIISLGHTHKLYS